MSDYDILPEEGNEKDDVIKRNPETPSHVGLRVIQHITVEPLGIVTLTVLSMYSLISKQYIDDYVAKSYGLNASTQHSACDNTSTSGLEDKVSAESSEWVLYLNIAGFIPSLITTVAIGSWGDIVGRRLPLLVGFFGYFLMVLCCLIVFSFELPIYYLFIGRGLCGITGNYAVILGSIFAYLADTSTKENRTVKVAVGSASVGIGGIFGGLLSGFWVEKHGFVPPFIFLVALVFVSILYIQFILKESKVINPMSLLLKVKLLFSKRPFTELGSLFTSLNQSLKIIGVALCFWVEIMVIDGFSDVSVIYELSPPFCWNSLLVGYAAALRMSSMALSLVTIKLLTKYASDYVFVVFGVFSNVSCFLFYAFSKISWMLFLGLVTGLLGAMNIVVYRSIPSKLVSVNSQGSIFALLALTESVSEISASFIMNPVYSTTVSWFPGFVFILLASFDLLLLCFFSFVYYKVKNDIKSTE